MGFAKKAAAQVILIPLFSIGPGFFLGAHALGFFQAAPDEGALEMRASVGLSEVLPCLPLPLAIAIENTTADDSPRPSRISLGNGTLKIEIDDPDGFTRVAVPAEPDHDWFKQTRRPVYAANSTTRIKTWLVRDDSGFYFSKVGPYRIRAYVRKYGASDEWHEVGAAEFRVRKLGPAEAQARRRYEQAGLGRIFQALKPGESYPVRPKVLRSLLELSKQQGDTEYGKLATYMYARALASTKSFKAGETYLQKKDERTAKADLEESVRLLQGLLDAGIPLGLEVELRLDMASFHLRLNEARLAETDLSGINIEEVSLDNQVIHERLLRAARVRHSQPESSPRDDPDKPVK